MCTTDKLVKAAIRISILKGGEVTAIQFEDGSGFKFNYQINGGDWKFIDLRD